MQFLQSLPIPKIDTERARRGLCGLKAIYVTDFSSFPTKHKKEKVNQDWLILIAQAVHNLYPRKRVPLKNTHTCLCWIGRGGGGESCATLTLILNCKLRRKFISKKKPLICKIFISTLATRCRLYHRQPKRHPSSDKKQQRYSKITNKRLQSPSIVFYTYPDIRNESGTV